MKPKSRAAPSAKAKALQWLSQREHSRVELRAKLLRWLQREAAAAEAAAKAATAHTASTEAAPAEDAEGTTATADAPDTREAASDWREQAEARVDALLDELDAARYLSDARFVESRIHVRQARFGNRRIEQELREHGLQPADTDRARLRESESARARQVMLQRFGDAPAPTLSPDDRLRRTRFLAARGFSFEAIRLALRLPDD